MIDIWQDAAGEWRFTVKGRNGERVATSEGYTTRKDAVRGFRALRRIIVEAETPKPTWRDFFKQDNR